MRILALIAALSIFTNVGCGAGGRDDQALHKSAQYPDNVPTGHELRKPLVVLMEYNPWLQVIGADCPSFALYNDGSVIFLHRSEGNAQYRSVSLGDNERDALEKSLAIDDWFFALNDDYEASVATDQPTNAIHVWQDGRFKGVSVYGDLRWQIETEGKPKREPSDDEVGIFDAGKVPEGFRSVFRKLVMYDHPAAKPWLPHKIEVMLWPRGGASEKRASWPSNWPGLNHPETKKRHSEQYSIFLPASEMDTFVKLLTSMTEKKQSLELGDKNWSVSYRFPFPAEELWMQSSE